MQGRGVGMEIRVGAVRRFLFAAGGAFAVGVRWGSYFVGALGGLYYEGVV
jgi:hypothetical protein